MPNEFLPVQGQISPLVLKRGNHPDNYGPLPQFNGHARVAGPCGDTMEFWVQIQEGRVGQVGFTTTGCCSSRAAGNMAAELATGRALEDAVQIEQSDILVALGGLPPESEHCALLAANTLHAAIRDFVRSKMTREESRHVVTPVHTPDRAPTVPSDEELARRQALSRKMSQIGYKILVLSGKGGVGKSTVAANLAVALANHGCRVGLLDYLVIDAPPGTGDEPLSVVQLVEHPAGAVLVTTPQSLSVDDVRRSVSFCRQLSLPVLGIVENMSGLACPHCGGQIDLFRKGGGERLAAEMDVRLLGQIPLDPHVVECSDDGVPLLQRCAEGPAAVALLEIVRHIVAAIESETQSLSRSGT